MVSTSVSDSRSRILAQLKRSPRTVEELAGLLGVTRNAIRSQLNDLQAAGWVERNGSRPSSRRPAHIYAVTDRLAVNESRAYAPVLAELLRVLDERLEPGAIVAALRAVGTRLAAAQPRPAGSRLERFRRAHAVLESLGATADLVVDGEEFRLEGCACPLSLAVEADARVCEAVRTMLSEIVGEQLNEQCDRGSRPRCRFAIAS